MDRLLHYRILGELGQGGMGQVLRAVDEKLGREVALKLLPAELAGEADWQARLLREARAASALNHPGIVTLHDLEMEGGRPFLVMELVEGETFTDLAKKGIPWERAVELVAAVADALAAAHARGILHRDVKSDNLMLTKGGHPKVLDFGLAKLRDHAGASMEPDTTARLRRPDPKTFALAATAHGPLDSAGLTRAGQIVGTPAYMAPECFEGGAVARSEIFALGVVLYELLVGKRPFDRDSEVAMMAAIQIDDPDPPSRAAPDRELPQRLDVIVARALAKLPEDRFPTMNAFAVALRNATKPPKRRVWPWLVASGVVFAAAIAAITLWVLAPGDRPASVPDSISIDVTASRRVTLEPNCEEYPRFHPDGKRVVYDGLVDGDYEILVLDLQTNQRRQLTKTPGWDYASALSPDGRLVAYVHEDTEGRTLRVANVDGDPAPRELGAYVGYPGWTAAGALLVGDASGQILELDLESRREKALGRLPPGGRLYHLIEVPGAGVAVLWWTSSEADATALGELDRDGTLRVIEETATDYEGGLAVSRSRRGYYATRKGFTEGNQLLFRPWGGGRPTVVPGGISPGAGVDVSRDRRRLVFSTCVERQHVASVSADRPPNVISRGSWQDTNPFVVGNRLFVTSDRLGQQHGWMIPLDGKEQPRAITPPGALGSSPSRDGTLIAYAAAGGRGGISVVDLAGGPPRALTTDPSDAAPMFTRDGKHVVFERTVTGSTHVFVVPADGGAARKIVAGAQPTPSPTDDTIAFVAESDASGARRVMLTDLAGAAPRELPGLAPAAWQRMRFSPDGKRLLLVRGYQQIVDAPLDGSAPPGVLWNATTGSVSAAVWGPGDQIIAVLGVYEGDLWLAEGSFP